MRMARWRDGERAHDSGACKFLGPCKKVKWSGRDVPLLLGAACCRYRFYLAKVIGSCEANQPRACFLCVCVCHFPHRRKASRVNSLWSGDIALTLTGIRNLFVRYVLFILVFYLAPKLTHFDLRHRRRFKDPYTHTL